MADINKTIKALTEWIEDPNAMNAEIDGSLVSDALELLKEQEQQPKLLTLEETINAKYPMDVFCEIKGEERIFAVTAPVPAQWIGKPDIRYWTARPTEEQRKAVPWKDGEHET